MIAHSLPAKLNELPHHRSDGLQFFPIISDNMEPTLCRGNGALVALTEEYTGPGIYVLDVGFGSDNAAIYRVETLIGAQGFNLINDNALYSASREVSAEWFASAVLAKVVVGLNVLELSLVAARV